MYSPCIYFTCGVLISLVRLYLLISQFSGQDTVIGILLTIDHLVLNCLALTTHSSRILPSASFLLLSIIRSSNSFRWSFPHRSQGCLHVYHRRIHPVTQTEPLSSPIASLIQSLISSCLPILTCITLVHPELRFLLRVYPDYSSSLASWRPIPKAITSVPHAPSPCLRSPSLPVTCVVLAQKQSVTMITRPSGHMEAVLLFLRSFM